MRRPAREIRGEYNNFSRSSYQISAQNAARATAHPSANRRAKLAASEIKSALFDRGGKLKLSRKHRPDYMIVVLILTLAIIGLVVLFSIAPALNSGNDAKTNAFMLKQAAFLAGGIGVFFVASRVPLDAWRKYGGWIFLAAGALCVAVVIPHFPLALRINGAARWFNLGSVGTFQPSEFLKFGTMLFAAGFLSLRTAQNRVSTWRDLLPFFAVTAAALFIIVVLQKDMGTGLALFAIVFVQLAVADVSWRKLLAILAVSALAGIFAIAAFSHRMDRITTFLGGGTEHMNYQINQALIAIGSGGVTGRGLGQSVQAFGWLPEQSTDSIFAILGETLGFLGLVVIIALFALLLRRIISKVDYTENLFLRLVLAGVFGWLAAHILLNIGAMTSLIPLTGVTLPLISFGGTSMLFIMASLGIVFAISGYTLHGRVAHGNFASENRPRNFNERRRA